MTEEQEKKKTKEEENHEGHESETGKEDIVDIVVLVWKFAFGPKTGLDITIQLFEDKNYAKWLFVSSCCSSWRLCHGSYFRWFGSRWWLLMLFLCKVDHDEQFPVAVYVCVCVKNVCVFGVVSFLTFCYSWV